MHKRFIHKLEKISGAGHVSVIKEDFICYGYDSDVAAGLPNVVVHPASTSEVSSLIEVAADERIPITARGAGTGLSGGSVQINDGLVLHFDRMNALKKLDPREMLAVLEPGVTNWELRRAARAAGLFYPPDPGSAKICTLGGNVAENAGGPSGVKYGTTGDYVIAL